MLNVKKNGDKTFVITDAGMNDLIRPALYQAHHQILPVKQTSGSLAKPVDIVGPVCESGDFFARDRAAARVQAPAICWRFSTRAPTGMTLSSNYNTRPRPAGGAGGSGRARLIRRRETMKDLFGPELDLAGAPP